MNWSQCCKKIFWTVLKLGLAGGIVAYMLWSDYTPILNCLKRLNYWWLLPAVFFYLSHMVVCSWRWRRLTEVIGVHLTFPEALSLTMQGYFFSLVVPGGAVGGDVVKIGVLAKRMTQGGRMEGAVSILMDRIVGMIALFLLALVLLALELPLILNVDVSWLGSWKHMPKVFAALVALLCLAGLGASCAIFFHRLLEKIPPFGWLMRVGDKLTHGLVSRLTAATDVYSRAWGELVLTTVVGIFFVHLLVVVPYGFLLTGLGVPFSALQLVTAVTIGNIAGLLPIFPGGVGGRDLVVVALLTAGGMAEGDARAVQLLATGILIFANLLGGLFFIADPGKRTVTRQENC